MSILVAAGLLFIGGWYGCNVVSERVFVARFGRPPSQPLGDAVREGMTPAEVLDAVGNPHRRYERPEGENWIYFLDSWGLDYNGMRFDRAGRVTSRWSP